jgi:hypothetical protein
MPRTRGWELTYATHVRPAIHDCLQAWPVYRVWESTGRFIPATSYAFAATRALRCRRVPVAIRSKLGFTEVTCARQGRQYERYRRVFRNKNNSTDPVISRRWTALQAPDGIVTTIRFRDPAVRLPYLLAGAYPFRDGETVTVRGSRRDLPGQDVIGVSSFTRHWLQIHHP